jgi:RNA polymerase sigma factor (sigma-70 family)
MASARDPGRRDCCHEAGGACTACIRRLVRLWGHRGDILRYVRRRGFGPAEAEDVVSDVYLTAWRRLADVPPAQGRDRGWLFVVAHNTIRNARRRMTSRRQAIEDLASRAEPDVGPAPTARVELAETLDSLSPADREVLWLAAIHGLSGPELAQVLDCSVSTATVRLSRARRRLAAAIDP